MIEQLYDVYFAGRIVEGHDREQVRQAIGNLFNASGGKLDHLFSGQPVRIKTAVNQDTAVAYRVKFRDTGALVDIRPLQRQQSPSTPLQEQAGEPSPAMSLLPPRSGSLIDCAPRVSAAVIPDISGIGLSPEGELLDDSPPIAAAEISTDSLSLSPARSGSLQDCQVKVTPRPIPDISRLRLEDPEGDR